MVKRKFAKIVSQQDELSQREQRRPLFLDDEVQMGRIGKLFAVEDFDIEPDILNMAIASGPSLSATIAKEEIIIMMHARLARIDIRSERNFLAMEEEREAWQHGR